MTRAWNVHFRTPCSFDFSGFFTSFRFLMLGRASECLERTARIPSGELLQNLVKPLHPNICHLRSSSSELVPWLVAACSAQQSPLKRDRTLSIVADHVLKRLILTGALSCLAEWVILRNQNEWTIATRWVRQELSGIVSCDSAASRIRLRIVQCEWPAKRQKPKPCKAKPRFFFPLLPVGSQESVLKVPKRGQLHTTIRMTPKRCDSCAQGALGRRTVLRRNFCDAESLAKCLRRNLPLRAGRKSAHVLQSFWWDHPNDQESTLRIWAAMLTSYQFRESLGKMLQERGFCMA